MLAHFIESSTMFQNGTVYLMYGIIVAFLYGIAAIMYVSGCRKRGGGDN